MVRKKKQKNKTSNNHLDKMNGLFHPILGENLTVGQKAADVITTFGGSWTFIILFFTFLFFWITINSWYLISRTFDPFPFILLNLLLSCLAAIQAPIILMSQNRQTQRDRVIAKYDYRVNRKAEREIQTILKEVSKIKTDLSGLKNKF